MGVVLVALPEELTHAAIERLMSQGDEVRVVEDDSERAALYRSFGAHVATGSPTDDELLERAAIGARTIVLDASDEAVVAAAVGAATRAEVERLVLVMPELAAPALERIDRAAIDYVALISGKRRRGRPPVQLLAQAIDAADDLAGAPRLILDLRTGDAWRTLGLTRP